MLGLTWYHPIVGIDIHWVMVPTPAPVPTPLPHPFTGLVFDPIGMAVGAAISGAMAGVFGGPFKGPVFINKMPAANTGTDGTNKMVMPHFPTPPGTVWAPVPAGLKPPIPGKPPDPGLPTPIPSNDATMITGSKTVYVCGTNACRLGDLSMSCGEPIRLPSSTSIAWPWGAPVKIGGPPALDFMSAALGMIRTQWVSGRLQSAVNRVLGEGSRAASWINRGICILTGHPVDVASGMVITESVDLELPGPIPFKFERVYHSCSTYDGPLGYGWAHSYDQSVKLDKDCIIYHAGDGRDIYFLKIRIGETTRNQTEKLGLKRLKNGFIVRLNNGLDLYFGPLQRTDGSYPLKEIRNSIGDKIILHYDEKKTLIKIIDSTGRVLIFDNDSLGRLKVLKIPHPEEERLIDFMHFEYNDSGDLAKVYDALENTYQYYYKHHLLVQEIDKNDFSFFFSYDGIDEDARCVRTWGEEGLFDHLLTYDKEKRVTTVENSLGETTVYFSDARGLIIKIVDPLGAETTFEYDDFFNKTLEKNALGQTTLYEYDTNGNRSKTTLPDGTERLSIFNKDNKITEVVDAVGGHWLWRYDKFGRLESETNPLNHSIYYRYQSDQCVDFETTEGKKTNLVYDDANNLTEIIYSNKARSLWKYDKLGRCVSVTDVEGRTQRRYYDLLNQVIKVEEFDGIVQRIEYDKGGNIIRIDDSATEKKFSYTPMGRLKSRSQADEVIQFTYNSEEQLVGVTNEVGSTYIFVLDPKGQVIAEKGFDGNKIDYVRDSVGKIVKVRRKDGMDTNYDYDALGRVINITQYDGSYAQFVYREDGELIKATNNSGSVEFELDVMGRIIREKQDDHWIMSTYDESGLRTSFTSSYGVKQINQRNNVGDLKRIEITAREEKRKSFFSKIFSSDFTHTESGSEIERTIFEKGKLNWLRNSNGKPLERNLTFYSNSIQRTNYTWNNKNLLERSNDDFFGEQSYEYNIFDDLILEHNHKSHIQYRIPDLVGNIYKTLEQSNRVFDSSGKILESEEAIYYYDNIGRLIKKHNHDGKIWLYEWDGFGMLISVEKPNGEKINFEYDAIGRRIGKFNKYEKIKWVWDKNVVLHEYKTSIGEKENSSDSAITWFFNPETFSPLAKLDDNEFYAIITDFLGVPEIILDHSGKRVWLTKLDIYGQPRQKVGSKSFCPYRYPGQHEDDDVKLYYNRFRYYDPNSGTYISQDPIGLAGGLNIYAYCRNPLLCTDPFGLDWNYQLRDPDTGEIYYNGRASDSQTPSDVMSRHAATEGADGARFRRGVDQFEQVTPPGTTRNIARGIEELGILERGEEALLGRGSPDVRGNKIHGVRLRSANRSRYLGAARGFLTRQGANGVDDLKVKVCS